MEPGCRELLAKIHGLLKPLGWKKEDGPSACFCRAARQADSISAGNAWFADLAAEGREQEI